MSDGLGPAQATAQIILENRRTRRTALLIAFVLLVAAGGGVLGFSWWTALDEGGQGPCNPHSAMVLFGISGVNGAPGGAAVSRAGSDYRYVFPFVHCLPADIVSASYLNFTSITPDCGAAAGPVTYSIESDSGSTIAIENATSGTWSGNATARLPTTGLVSVESRLNLSPDALEALSGGGLVSLISYSLPSTPFSCAVPQLPSSG